MPFDYRIDPAVRLGAVAFYGTVSAEDVVGAMEALFGDEAWEAGFLALWDGRGVRGLVVEPGEFVAVMAASERLVERAGRGAAAVIISDPEAYASAFLMRKHIAPVTGREIRLASTLPEALALLGVGRLPEPIEALLDEHPPEGEA